MTRMFKPRSLVLVFGAAFASAWLFAGIGSSSAADAKKRATSAGPASPPPYVQQQNIIYGEIDGIGLLMDVFKPVGPKNGLGIIDIVSGAWQSDRGKLEEHRAAKFFDIFCSRGYTVFAIRPGSRSKFSVPEMLTNIRIGIRWVRNHARDYGIDPENMAISGASAGGHLVCLTIVKMQPGKDGKVEQPFKAVAVFFPPTDFLSWNGYLIDFSRDDDWGRLVRGLALTHEELVSQKIDKKHLTERVRQISPARLVQGKLPPFLIVHGDTDAMVPLQQSQEFIEELKKAGNSAELIVKPGGGHPWRTIPEEIAIMADWFDKQLKPKPKP